ncbi:DUF58 domain-containing protein [Halothiobacillus sp. DCM-1]|uniref:DUF58 domain-containing protein n=1 Tax=Halothiobacillus sp. DCM-1 TaxID=3112558 RepID=UPI0032444B2A
MSAQLAIDPIPSRFADESVTVVLHIVASLPNAAVSVWLDAREIDQIQWRQGVHHYPLILPTMPRGQYTAPHWRLVSRFPMGLWTVTRRLDTPQPVYWVYPSRQGTQPITQVSRIAHEPSSGQKLARLVGAEEFDHLRPYQPGDSRSRIAFKRYARTGQLVSQQWGGQPVAQGELIQLDFDRMTGDTEQRLSQMSAWIDQLAKEDQAFVLRLGNGTELSGHDAEHRRRCWQALASFGQPRPSEH